jgi:hypothetical protein
MTKRYRITVQMTGDGDEYDIEHEADQVLLDIGHSLYFGDAYLGFLDAIGGDRWAW